MIAFRKGMDLNRFLVVKFMDEVWALATIGEESIELCQIDKPRSNWKGKEIPPSRIQELMLTEADEIMPIKQITRKAWCFCYPLADVLNAIRKREYAFVDPLIRRYRDGNAYESIELILKRGELRLLKPTVKDIQEYKDKASRKPRRAA
jgi:hypothetical protein